MFTFSVGVNSASKYGNNAMVSCIDIVQSINLAGKKKNTIILQVDNCQILLRAHTF